MSEQVRQPSRGVVKRMTVRDAAEQAIREMILSGELAPRTRLNEVLIAEELGISRGPLREAIQRLASEGLLRIVSHKGAFVSSIEKDELRQLYELRIALEVFTARKACTSLSDDQRRSFRDSLEGSMDAPDGGGAYPADIDFHRALVGLGDNQILGQAATDVNTRISIARNRSAREPARAREASMEHAAIADALVDGDVDTMTSLLEAHLRRSLENATMLLLQ